MSQSYGFLLAILRNRHDQNNDDISKSAADAITDLEEELGRARGYSTALRHELDKAHRSRAYWSFGAYLLIFGAVLLAVFR